MGFFNDRGNCMQSTAHKELKSQRLLRLPEILDIFPVSKSTWWAGVKDGRYPRSVKLGPRTTAWREFEILELIDRLCLNVS